MGWAGWLLVMIALRCLFCKLLVMCYVFVCIIRCFVLFVGGLVFVLCVFVVFELGFALVCFVLVVGSCVFRFSFGVWVVFYCLRL